MQDNFFYFFSPKNFDLWSYFMQLVFLSAFPRNYFLCWDHGNGDVPPTLGVAPLNSSRAGSDLGLESGFVNQVFFTLTSRELWVKRKDVNNRFLPFWIEWPIKTLNRKFFRSIYQKKFQNMFVIENKLSLSYRRVKSMHYPESPKVTSSIQILFYIRIPKSGHSL